MITTRRIQDRVREYYGRILKNHRELKTSACCSGNGLVPRLQRILEEIEPEIREKHYGCGSPIPNAIEGCTVLDLGCGTGRDTYLVSGLVGPAGRVIGVDMTEEQLAVARKFLPAQMKRFGFDRPNVDFRHGVIEDLESVGIADESVDVVISNCVINLSPDKPRVFSEILRALKPGGEMYIADVFCDRRLPTELMNDQTLVGECLAGAMYIEDFRRLLAGLGGPDYRVMARNPIILDDAEIEAKLGLAQFFSVTFRAFKLPTLEDRCEDYGQIAEYLGTIPDEPHSFRLDDHHLFETGRPVPVCGNTASMLSETRLAPHFRVTGNRRRHFGLFPCSPTTAPTTKSTSGTSCC
ncbi:MAG: methyltransferase domain-containing protein [Candidatus Hydrogenedentes bacterium]|nr:methyltransferase domain-containing protein [Candidatus Hydrogenedentota bacterium]